MDFKEFLNELDKETIASAAEKATTKALTAKARQLRHFDKAMVALGPRKLNTPKKRAKALKKGNPDLQASQAHAEVADARGDQADRFTRARVGQDRGKPQNRKGTVGSQTKAAVSQTRVADLYRRASLLNTRS